MVNVRNANTYRQLHVKHKRAYLLLILCMMWGSTIFSQSSLYTAKRISLSSGMYDEFSPYPVNDGMVYCSNRPAGSMIKYEKAGDFLFNIYFAKSKKGERWNNGKLFTDELTTKFNDGPACFNKEATRIYFSRNIYIHGRRKKITGSDNKIGLFWADYMDGKWTNITAFPHNGTDYSVIGPSITADGTTLFFSSDKPGGYGGYDIYYSRLKDGEWQVPVNMGPKVNTAADETHPFISAQEKLFFASNGHPGLGGKDIFYTQQVDEEWTDPVHLDAEINSPSDDFGFFTGDDLQSGYFSSNRKKTDDIYSFKKRAIDFENCKEQLENNYCFVLYDEKVEMLDTVPAIYEWDFGNNEKLLGKKVQYCFPGPGEYSVLLRVMNKHTGDTINIPSPYEIELKEHVQATISSPAAGVAGDTLYFEGVTKNLPDFEVKEYLWDFGKGFERTGASVSYPFEKAGEYKVKLGLTGQTDSIGEQQKTCVYKKIVIRKKE